MALTIACGAAPGSGGGAGSQPVSAYIDDRSSAVQLIRSYYDAIGRRQYLRASSYWEPGTTLPNFDVFEKGFAGTTAVQVELGTVGGGTGAGQLYWSVPVVVLSTTTAGAQAFIGCYTLHLTRPDGAALG